jgi:hypothetical protein
MEVENWSVINDFLKTEPLVPLLDSNVFNNGDLVEAR